MIFTLYILLFISLGMINAQESKNLLIDSTKSYGNALFVFDLIS